MVGIRKEMRQQDRDSDLVKVEKLMVRIGIFSLLYSLPTLVVIACCIYEYQYLELWTPNVKCKQNARTGPDAVCYEWSQPRPRVEIYMLKIFMNLVVGITCGMWVLSRKTFSTWRRFLTCGLLKGPGSKFVAYQPATVHQPTPAVSVPLINLNLRSTSSSQARYGFQTRTASEASAKL